MVYVVKNTSGLGIIIVSLAVLKSVLCQALIGMLGNVLGDNVRVVRKMVRQ